MSKPSEQNRFTTKLAEQLQFIHRSAAAFDQGMEVEAIRIATSLRVIFHQTASSTSLVTHLGFNQKQMLSSSRGHGDWKDYLAHVIDLRSTTLIRMKPILGNQFHHVSIDEWWQGESVFIHAGVNHSRRKIILSAANKDGGAHVDSGLDEYYEFLAAGENAIGITGNLEYDGPIPFPQGVAIYPKNAHLALIRQFAHESLTAIAYFGWMN